MTTASNEEVSRLIQEWFQRELDRAWRQFHSGSMVEEAVADVTDAVERRARQRFIQSEVADRKLDDLRESFLSGDYSEGAGAAEEIVAGLDAPITTDDRRFTLIAREVLKGMGHIADSEARWADGREDYTPEWQPELSDRLFPVSRPTEPTVTVAAVAPADVPPAVIPPKVSGVTLSEAFERYTTFIPMEKGTITDFAVSIRRFVELHGDLDLHSITKRHVIAFKDMLLRLPRSAKRGTLPELVAKAERDKAAGKDVPRLSPVTINDKSLAALRATLNYALDNDLVTENVSARIAVRVDRDAAPSRLLYDPSDLKKIFGLPIFTVGQRPDASGGEAAVWLPILAIYTGARLAELAMLRVGDVRTRDDLRFIFIHRGKTGNARRKVPLHSEVVRLGFLDYLATRGTRPDSWLFPAFDNGREQPTGFWSQWWGRYARTVIPDTRKTFHSTRHTVKNVLRNARVDKTLRDAVMGHKNKDVAERYGLDEDGEGFALPLFAEAIEQIRYPGLEIVVTPAVQQSINQSIKRGRRLSK